MKRLEGSVNLPCGCHFEIYKIWEPPRRKKEFFLMSEREFHFIGEWQSGVFNRILDTHIEECSQKKASDAHA